MKKYLYLILVFFFFLPCASATRIELTSGLSSITQGDLVKVSLIIPEIEDVDLTLLRDKTFGNVVYFYEVSPLVKGEGDNYLKAQAKVIFVKVPEAKELQDTVGTRKIRLEIKGFEVVPTNAEQQLIFGTFEVPERNKWPLIIAVVLLVLAPLSFLIYKVICKRKKKQAELERRHKMKKEVLECRNYEDVVNIWKKKQLILNEFPHVKEAFLKMEKVLNRHQFKPRQTEIEKIEVVESYREFARTIEGGFNGV